MRSAHLTGSSRQVDPDDADRGKAILGAGGAMVWPGVGHLIAGKPRTFVALAIIGLLLAAVGLSPLYQSDWLPILVVVLPVAVLFHFFQMIDAAQCAKRSISSPIGDVSTRFLAGVFLSLLGMGECFAATRYLQNNWVEICYSPTPSMAPNIVPGDYFLMFKRTSYHRWDIVGLNVPDGFADYPRLCKRMVGLPGETVELTGPALLIDGKPTKNPAGAGPYLAVDNSNNPLVDAEPMSAGNGCWGRPITLGRDEYYLLGDNTTESYDARLWPALGSRQAGAIPSDVLTGRIAAIVWPPDRWRLFKSDGDAK